MDILNESAEAEERTGFDASGSGGGGLSPEVGGEANREHGSASGSSKSPPTWSSQTDDTSMSQAMSSLDLDTSEYLASLVDTHSGDDLCYGGDLNGLDGEGKDSLLFGMFPTLKPFDVKWALKKHKGDLNRTIDELMTQSFLDQNGERHKGIEAFSESDIALPRKSKGKSKKRKNRQIDSVLNTPVSESPSPVDKWDSAKNDIEFISSRSGMPTKQVVSIYHKNGGSLQAAISAIIEAHLELKLEVDDPLIQSQAIDLGHEFPTIPPANVEALVQIGHPSFANSRDLAEALVTPRAPQPRGKPNIQIEFRPAPLQLDQPPTTPKPGPHSTAHNRYGPGMPLESVTNIARKHIQTRDAAFEQARAAYRRGKSDPLMGGAAAYYSQEGRDADSRARQAMSAAADRLVEMQSWKGGVDLHGVTVEDSKRIVREKVTGWWHELGRDGEGVGAGYRIVTGVGNHSEGGVGKLGPAVGRMLIREGWKVQVGTGYLVVTGIVKKK